MKMGISKKLIIVDISFNKSLFEFLEYFVIELYLEKKTQELPRINGE